MNDSLASVKCPKCGGNMEEGFSMDIRQSNIASQQKWIEGYPEKSFLSLGLKIKGKKALPISTLRCQSCGFLESYARSNTNL
jgi:hypothetical protein